MPELLPVWIRHGRWRHQGLIQSFRFCEFFFETFTAIPKWGSVILSGCYFMLTCCSLCSWNLLLSTDSVLPKLKMAVFWVLAPSGRSLPTFHWCLLPPSSGWWVSRARFHTALHPRKPRLTSSQPWKLEISYLSKLSLYQSETLWNIGGADVKLHAFVFYAVYD
jgi:hypothetical protein